MQRTKQTIRCPNCEHVQDAEIITDDIYPWPIYIHECERCDYLIMESEWEVVDDPQDETSDAPCL
jgi:C4-type Zn-finger protein